MFLQEMCNKAKVILCFLSKYDFNLIKYILFIVGNNVYKNIVPRVEVTNDGKYQMAQGILFIYIIKAVDTG